jgi:phytoene dehydrogenase-like protein
MISTGLASAIALKASGHNVLVLEKEPQLGGTSSVSMKYPILEFLDSNLA